MNNVRKILIVGGNAAGPSAAAKAKRTDPEAEVILFEAGEFISTGTCELPYLLAGEITSYKDIVFFDPDSFYEKKGVKVHIHYRVEQIDRKLKSVAVRNLKDNSVHNFYYDKLILTTGAKANKLPELSADYENVFNLKSVSNFIAIDNYLKNNSKFKKALIIGSGYIGLETAEAFAARGFDVSVVEKAQIPMPTAEKEISYLILDSLKKKNINFYASVEDLKFNKSNNRIESVQIEGRIKEFDIIIQAVGFKPNNNLALGANLDLGESGALVVDTKMKTSDPHIYAAGDNCESKNRITKRNFYFPLATIAHEQGHAAGANAAGGNIYTEPIVKNIAVKIFESVYVSVGLNEKEAEINKMNFSSVSALAHNLVPVMPESRKVFGKLIYENSSKLILGASFYGGPEVIGYGDLISSLIYNNNSAASLAKIDFNYTPPYSPFKNLLSILGRKIK